MLNSYTQYTMNELAICKVVPVEPTEDPFALVIDEPGSWYVKNVFYDAKLEKYLVFVCKYRQKVDKYSEQPTLEQEMKEITGRGRKHPDLPPC
mgnify:CR=1 FL=1